MMLCLSRLEKELPILEFQPDPPEEIESTPAGDKTKMLSNIRSQYYMKPLQTALTYMVLGDQDRAIAALRYGISRGDFTMRWLHLWPFLDPLRGHRRFQRLLQQYKIIPPGRALT